MRKLLLLAATSLLALSSTAQAHFQLMSPAPTVPSETIGKGAPPCGPDTAMAATPTPVQGGHTIKLMLNENVRHGGFYRVALGVNSRSEIPVDNVVYDGSKPPKVLPPSGMPSGMSDHADFEDPAVFPVLADNLFPHVQNGPTPIPFMADIMLPNVTCARCTLQVIEFMTPHGFNAGGGYFYHHCAELKITADPALPAFGSGTDGGTPDAAHVDAKPDTSGGTAGTNGSGGAGGASGTTGSGGGAAGTSGAGTAGTNGTAGVGGAGSSGTAGSSSTAGVTGSSTGSAGTGAAARGSSGGCSYAPGRGNGTAAIIASTLLAGLMIARRRKR